MSISAAVDCPVRRHWKETLSTPWHKLKNAYLSLSTYTDLGPDLSCRRQVRHTLKSRPVLSRHHWCHSLWPEVYSAKILAFLYDHLSDYSGLEAGRLRPADDLDGDLSWTRICSFDWDAALCDDFQQAFGYDISDALMGAQFATLEDLVICLHQQP